MKKTVDDFNSAATAASQGAQLYNLARSRQLSTRITLLGLGTSPELYSTLQYALQQRFGSNGVSYRTMLRDGLTPGDVAAATIIAADIKSTPEGVIAEAKTSGQTHHRRCKRAQDARVAARDIHGAGVLDYTDDPDQRAAQSRRHDGGRSRTSWDYRAIDGRCGRRSPYLLVCSQRHRHARDRRARSQAVSVSAVRRSRADRGAACAAAARARRRHDSAVGRGVPGNDSCRTRRW